LNDPSGHSRGLRRWSVAVGSGFEYRREHGLLSLVNVMCCHVEVSATGRAVA